MYNTTITSNESTKSNIIKHTTRNYICPICLCNITTISFDNKHGINSDDQIVVNMLVDAHVNIKHNDNTIVMIIKDESTLINQ